MNLNDVDLNLLFAFDVLMEEKSVTKAAQRLCVSQSAMSHTLRRLRGLLDDPVLVSSLGGMRPTPRALELIDPVRQALALLDRTISPPAIFDPGVNDTCFALGSTDYVEYVILPPLIKRLAKIAPNIRIQLKRFMPDEVEECLEKGMLDLVIRLQQHCSKRLQAHKLLQEMPVVLVRVNHPDVGDFMTPDLYCTLRHVVIDSFEMSSRVQQIWQDHGIERTVALRSPNFLSAPLILAESDMIATLPLKIARMFTRGGRLKIVPFPLLVSEFNLEMVWHTLLEKDPSQCWFREQVIAVAAELEAGGT
jgi:DNA-binding transcriptional LysR family regulator